MEIYHHRQESLMANQAEDTSKVYWRPYRRSVCDSTPSEFNSSSCPHPLSKFLLSELNLNLWRVARRYLNYWRFHLGIEQRFAGSFCFSRKRTEHCTSGYFFVTLVYQFASSSSSIQEDVTRSIRENHVLRDCRKPFRDQMEAPFLQPL
ncbi:hypothetical protein BDR03DRAFT_383063 [Suillus americanus]|nr:hypothetical protein BDR03DRAFT_383063 [Suillus americanus]